MSASYSGQAWSFTLIQLCLGFLFAMFYDYSSIVTVLIFGISQVVFTAFAFAKFGASKRHLILQMFFVGEALKIVLFAGLVFIYAHFYSLNFKSLVVTVVYLQLLSFLAPLVIK